MPPSCCSQGRHFFPNRSHECGEALRRDQLQVLVPVQVAALRGGFFIHDACDLCFEAQCRLVRFDAFGHGCSRLQALLGQAVPAGACLQIAEQIWVEVCLRYRSDAVLARLRGQADLQWHLARRLQEAVGFCLGDGHSGGRVPHQTLLDELDEAFGATFEARRGPRLCCFSRRRQPSLARLPVPLLKERQLIQPRGCAEWHHIHIGLLAWTPHDRRDGIHEVFARWRLCCWVDELLV